MITKEFVDYIEKQLNSGASKDQITASLSGSNWSLEDIAEALDAINQKKELPVQINPSPQTTAPSVENPSLKHSSKKGWVILALILILVGGAVAYLFYNKNSKEPLPVVEQAKQEVLPIVENLQPESPKPLKINYVSVPVEDNNAQDFNAINVSVISNADKSALSKYISDPASTSTLSITDSQRILTANSNILKIFDGAMEKRYYQCSTANGPCSYNTLQTVSDIALLEAINLKSQGKHTEAMIYINKVIALGLQITAEADDDIEILVGWQIQRKGYTWLSKLGGTVLSTDDIKNRITALRLEHKKVLNFRYTRILETIDYITSRDNKLSFALNPDFGEEEYLNDYRKVANAITWKPEDTKNMFFVSIQKELGYIDLPCGSSYPNSKIDTDFNTQDTSSINQPNFVGRSFYSNSYASLGTMNIKRCDVEKSLGSL